MSTRPVSKSCAEYSRGIVGGLLFSLPLLYTMEVWYQGFMADPAHLVVGLVVVFLLLLGFNRYAGIRRDANWLEVVIDSVEEMGIGLLLSAFVLFLLGRIDFHSSAHEIFGKIVLQAITTSIGVSVGTAQMQGAEGGSRDTGMAQGDEGRFSGLAQLVMALCGAVLLASNMAPTEEILSIASSIQFWNFVGLIVVSLVVSAMILEHSFAQRAERKNYKTTRTEKFEALIITYGAALMASALLLWVYGQLDGLSPRLWVQEIIVLGFVAALGASAGRFLLNE